jgi:putative DNA primase/helicase
MGIRVDQRNNLLIPLTDGKDLHSLQFIRPDGTKRCLKGGKTKSMYYPIRLLEQPEKVLICEGFATAVTSYMESRTPVIAAFYANNLMPVAMAIRERWPQVELIIAGDDDRQTRGNPGASKARDAAHASGAALALPQWPKDAPEHLTDFNDLARWLNGGAS